MQPRNGTIGLWKTVADKNFSKNFAQLREGPFFGPEIVWRSSFSRDGLAWKTRFWPTQFLLKIDDHVFKSDFGPILIRTKTITWEWTPSNAFLDQIRDPRVSFWTATLIFGDGCWRRFMLVTSQSHVNNFVTNIAFELSHRYVEEKMFHWIILIIFSFLFFLQFYFYHWRNFIKNFQIGYCIDVIIDLKTVSTKTAT